MAFICGSLRNQVEDDLDFCSLSAPSPTKTRQKRNIFHIRGNKTTKNPYSDRGLDKFEALLEELDHKRQKIFTQKGAEDVSMVKFIYTSPDEVKPILVKFQDHRKHNNTSSIDHIDHTSTIENQKDVSNANGDLIGANYELVDYIKIKFDQCIRNIGEWWKPSYYVSLFVILILVLLMFSGRSFAILCVSIGWYFVPIIDEAMYNSKQPKKIVKKEYLKKK
ncbi:uncharacterized protein [Rutidosis leptorrhynchoides]|uniref:uncharacterized protein n=1 Tax=Rutidosis leptorrhynchoides TaxID=125765 RepID=UPI003A999E73